jgi:hypothetical protein
VVVCWLCDLPQLSVGSTGHPQVSRPPEVVARFLHQSAT